MNRRAMTLLELLVVMAIVAVLIGILLPALSGARRLARLAVCLSNHHQIGAAMAVYAGVHHDFVPREGHVRADHARQPWCLLLRPYMGDPDTGAGDLRSEDPDGVAGDRFARAPYYRDPARRPDGHNVHYVTNGMPFLTPDTLDELADDESWRRRGPMPLYRLPFPATTLHMTDFGDDLGATILNILPLWRSDGGVGQFYDAWAIEHVADGGPQQRVSLDRHGNGSAATFFDGHAALVPRESLAGLEVWNDRVYGVWR
jgi:prepilin-type N-terminal cleavage/methylation domain-containing protein/prepilin-type processing-associated H-X9-DG protein